MTKDVARLRAGTRKGARMSLPLAETRILDVTNVIAGPLASHLAQT